jgi:GT2 family glycosyltransferase
MKTITVVLVNWNQYEYTAACIRSLLAADAPPGGTLRIVLVDNGSADGSGARLQAAFGCATAPTGALRAATTRAFARRWRTALIMCCC